LRNRVELVILRLDLIGGRVDRRALLIDLARLRVDIGNRFFRLLRAVQYGVHAALRRRDRGITRVCRIIPLLFNRRPGDVCH
jgi:hypothetical protein